MTIISIYSINRGWLFRRYIHAQPRQHTWITWFWLALGRWLYLWELCTRTSKWWNFQWHGPEVSACWLLLQPERGKSRHPFEGDCSSAYLHHLHGRNCFPEASAGSPGTPGHQWKITSSLVFQNCLWMLPMNSLSRWYKRLLLWETKGCTEAYPSSNGKWMTKCTVYGGSASQEMEELKRKKKFCLGQ